MKIIKVYGILAKNLVMGTTIKGSTFLFGQNKKKTTYLKQSSFLTKIIL